MGGMHRRRAAGAGARRDCTGVRLAGIAHHGTLRLLSRYHRASKGWGRPACPCSQLSGLQAGTGPDAGRQTAYVPAARILPATV